MNRYIIDLRRKRIGKIAMINQCRMKADIGIWIDRISYKILKIILFQKFRENIKPISDFQQITVLAPSCEAVLVENTVGTAKLAGGDAAEMRKLLMELLEGHNGGKNTAFFQDSSENLW